MFVIPLLATSFIFATGVVAFGFVSNVAFKLSQSVYFKADRRLKNILMKMAAFKAPKQKETEKEQTQGEPENITAFSSECSITGTNNITHNP